MILRRCPQIFLGCCMLAALHAVAQDKMPIKFGKVTPQDFAVNADQLDSSAGAIVVADIGSTVGYTNLGRSVQDFHRSARLRILKRTGFDAATIVIPLFASSTNFEKIVDLKASTYNLEDGKVVETKLDDPSIFTEKVVKGLNEEKFTFPALKEGSIIEYSYTLSSPFGLTPRSWTFQGKYPCLWSEYRIEMPQEVNYVKISQGNLPIKVSNTFTLNGKTNSRWVMTDIPALKLEPYTTSLENYVVKLEFQLTALQYLGLYNNLIAKWDKISENLLTNEYFGLDLDSRNAWLDDDLNTITRGAANMLEKAQKVYAYIRDSFTCTVTEGVLRSQPLRTIYKNRNGSVADLNLLLAAMLIHEKIAADPVILSTRSHGFTNDLYPELDRYNYVITRIVIDNAAYYLDASEPWLGFGRLPERCYNGTARVVNKETSVAVILSADSVVDGVKTLVMLGRDEKGGLSARIQSYPGYNDAMEMRKSIKEHGEQEFLHKILSGYSGDATVSNLELDSLKLPDEPLGIAYDLNLRFDTTADIYYFNPMLGEGYKENPFKAAQRFYPVEMPYAMDKTYILNMDIPDGYVVDELPKSAKILLNTDEGFFEYIVSRDDQQINFRARIKLMKANYQTDDYGTLRDFFAGIVKKESEQIVFKKKK